MILDAQRAMSQLFVRNLSFLTTETELEKEFGEIGQVRHLHLAKDKDGKSLGYGFVTMATKDDAQKALETLLDRRINGRRLRLEIAERRHRAEGLKNGKNEMLMYRGLLT